MELSLSNFPLSRIGYWSEICQGPPTAGRYRHNGTVPKMRDVEKCEGSDRDYGNFE